MAQLQRLMELGTTFVDLNLGIIEKYKIMGSLLVHIIARAAESQSATEAIISMATG
jgi:hypothetical protein